MTATPQAELPLFRVAKDDTNIRWLENLLRGQGHWMTALEILKLIDRIPTDNERRWLRELASASEWILSGQKGYLHIEHSTVEEINHAASWLESQAKKMSDRACRLRRNGHRILS